jgi:hypothetical protein
VVYHKRAGEVGVLKRKRLLKQNISRDSEDLDWALCSFDRNLLKLSNTVLLPDGNILDPKNVAQDDPRDTAVWVNTGPTGVEKGFIMGDYSLLALPGSKKFQRMWIVVLDRPVRKFSQCHVRQS